MLPNNVCRLLYTSSCCCFTLSASCCSIVNFLKCSAADCLSSKNRTKSLVSLDYRLFLKRRADSFFPQSFIKFNSSSYNLLRELNSEA